MKAKALFMLMMCFLISSFSVYSQKNDVRTGMNMEDALTIAKNCVLAASSFRDPRIPVIKEIRPSDSLQFVGIVDEVRLDTLRRFIVRNSEFGVQSVWGFYKEDEKGDFARHFIISYSALEKIKLSSTITELATTIASSAGLPKLPVAKATQIVADCRNFVTKDNNEEIDKEKPQKSGDPLPKKPFETKRPTKEDFPTDDSENSKQKRDVFFQCLKGGEIDNGDKDKVKIGVQSAGITDPTNKVLNYILTESGKTQIEAKMKQDKATYCDLIESLAENAEVPLSPEILATYLVVNAILDAKTRDGKTTRKEVLLNNLKLEQDKRGEVKDFEINSFILPKIIQQLKIEGDTKFSEVNIDIDFDNFKEKLKKLLSSSNILARRKINGKLLVMILTNFQSADLDKLTSEKTIDYAIYIVEEIIMKQSTKQYQ